MEEKLVRLYYTPVTDSLDLWIGNPEHEKYSNPLTDNIVIKYSEKGEVIGLEILEFSKLTRKDLGKLSSDVRKVLIETIAKLTKTLAEKS
ncbi:MAG: DUF2283 domain-containing protein [archaeon]|nr:DUF2283 domain-containing protein [archaeon]MCP8313916.1 DUF2283 domain-containing protein [archaeon]MCP8320593.1 DUF2283 domain-containing protein [archaeon]